MACKTSGHLKLVDMSSNETTHINLPTYQNSREILLPERKMPNEHAMVEWHEGKIQCASSIEVMVIKRQNIEKIKIGSMQRI